MPPLPADPSFSAPELVLVERCLGARPWPAELAGPLRLARDPMFARAGQLYPSVAAALFPGTGTAIFYDAAFTVPLVGPRRGGPPGADAVNIVLGASLGREPPILAAWNRVARRPGARLPAVLLVELTEIVRAVTWRGAERAHVDVAALAPGLDLGVTYALYCRHERGLQRVREDLWRFFAQATLAADVSTLNQQSTFKVPLRG